MNRTFRFGLFASALGLVAGALYKVYLARTGTCAGLFGVAPTDGACSSAESWTMWSCRLGTGV